MTIKKQDMHVSGNKINTIESMMNDEGFMEDRYGNKIYITDSKENKERLEKLVKPEKKVTNKKLVVKKLIKKVAKKKK